MPPEGPFKGPVLFNDDDTSTINDLINSAQFELVIVDEPAGIVGGKCCYLTGSIGGIPTIALASISNANHVPAYGVSVGSAADGQPIRIVKRGTVPFDTTALTRSPDEGEILYLGENGNLQSDPTAGVNGNLQVARVTLEGINGLITIELDSFKLSADFDGVLRSIIENTSDGENAAASFTAKNDAGHYTSFGINSSGVVGFVPHATFIFNQGFGPILCAVDGNFGFEWFTDVTDSHNLSVTKKMELSADGKLTGRGSIKFDGDVTEDGGVWSNMTMKELKAQFDETAFSISTSAYERASLSLTVDQSIASGAFVAVDWDQEDIDVGDIHDNVTNPSRITVSKAGDYLLMSDVQFDANAAGDRGIRFAKNGVAIGQTETVRAALGGADTYIDAATFVRLAANDYIEVEVLQTDGVSLDILSAGCSFTLVRLYDTA